MALEFFGFHQHVAHVGEEEDGDDEQGDHGSDLIELVDQGIAHPEECAAEQEEGEGDHAGPLCNGMPPCHAAWPCTPEPIAALAEFEVQRIAVSFGIEGGPYHFERVFCRNGRVGGER